MDLSFLELEHELSKAVLTPTMEGTGWLLVGSESANSEVEGRQAVPLADPRKRASQEQILEQYLG